MNLSKHNEVVWQEAGVGVSLSNLEHLLGSDVIGVHVPPQRPEPVIQALDMYDVLSDDLGGEGVLMCVVSAHTMRASALADALEQAVRGGCEAVAVKVPADARDPRGGLIARVLEHGLAVVVLAEHASWREFDAMVTRALGENAHSLHTATSQDDKLFALANTIARVFQGSVAIEDHQRRILAHSAIEGQAIDELRTSGILFRKAGDAPVNERRYQEVLAATGIVRFTGYRTFLPRAAIAIRAGAIPLGTIWALDPEGEYPEQVHLNSEKQEVLIEGANIAAGVMLEAWQSSSGGTSRREAALKRILVGAGSATDAELLNPGGEELGAMLVCQIPKGRRLAVRLSELRAALHRHLGIYVPHALFVVEGSELAVLCPTPQVEQVRAWVVEAVSELREATLDGVRIGVSSPQVIGPHLAYAANEAREVAACTEEAGETIGTVARVRPQLFLRMCAAQFELDERLILPEVQELHERGESGRHLVETLECWLGEAGNVANVAQILRVHEQTVRYRLRKLRELLPLDTASHEYLLTVWLQLHLLRRRQHAQFGEE